MIVVKLVATIIGIVLLAFFTGFNLNNKCDVFFFYTTFKNVPVFITVFISVAVGILATLPIALFGKKRKETPEEVREKLSKIEKQQAKLEKARLREMKGSAPKSSAAETKAEETVSKEKNSFENDTSAESANDTSSDAETVSEKPKKVRTRTKTSKAKK